MAHAPTEQPVPQPLSGIRIIDFTTLLPGPLATLMLAEAGAEVIKVERPGGDDMRRLGVRLPSGQSALFGLLSRGKRMLELDLRSPEGARQAHVLIGEADVLVEQNRPGVMARLGFGYTALAVRHPRLIYCSITGYGQHGPRAQWPGHDLNYAAEAGLLSQVAGRDGAPVLPPALIADIGGGALPAVLNILLALRQREQTGEGCHLDISMAEGLMTFKPFAIADAIAGTRPSGPGAGLLTGGSPRYQLYETSDRCWLAVGALEDKFWRNFCDAIGLEAKYRRDEADAREAIRAVARLVRARTAADWLTRFAATEACVSLVRDAGDVIDASSSGNDTTLPVPVQRRFRRR